MRSGFTAIELLVTLFIAAMALTTGYQLYAAIAREDSNTRMDAAAGAVAYENVKRHGVSATAPCTPLRPVDNQSITIESISNAQLTVVIDCPNSAVPNLSRVTATITFGDKQRTVTHGSYVNPGGV